MEYKFGKVDTLSSLIVGEIIAVFFILIAMNLHQSVPLFSSVLEMPWAVITGAPIIVLFLSYLSFYLGKSYGVIFQFGKFVLVGISNTAVDLGLLNGLIFLTDKDSGAYYTLFKAASFAVGLINSYAWNKFWAFGDKKFSGLGSQFTTFSTISLVGFFINVSVASVIVNIDPPFQGISHGLWANVGALIALFFTIIWNFLGYKFFVFRH